MRALERPIALAEVESALAWFDPARDTQLARATAMRALDQRQRLNCVWTGVRLGPGVRDIDHCLPGPHGPAAAWAWVHRLPRF